MVMKSTVGSRKVIDILNRLGHSVSYTTVEELCRFVETLSGKDTLHDTVGIAYQLSAEEIENSDKKYSK